MFDCVLSTPIIWGSSHSTQEEKFQKDWSQKSQLGKGGGTSKYQSSKKRIIILF